MHTTYTNEDQLSRSETHYRESAGINIPSIGLPKLTAAIMLGAVVTFSIFVLMHHLIANEQTPNISIEPITFTSSIYKEVDEKINEDRYKIKPPPVLDKRPEVIRDTIPKDEVTDVGFDDSIQAKIDPVSTETQFTGFIIAGDARPIVRINPDYPPEAARDGIEGWVELRFSIDQSGAVKDVIVLDSQPKRVFDRAAKRALRRWKYQAKIEQGKAVVQRGMSVMLEFKLSV